MSKLKDPPVGGSQHVEIRPRQWTEGFRERPVFSVELFCGRDPTKRVTSSSLGGTWKSSQTCKAGPTGLVGPELQMEHRAVEMDGGTVTWCTVIG